MRARAPWPAAVWRGAAALVSLLLASVTAGCVSTAAVRGAPESAPLVERREAAIGVFYPGAVRAAEYRNEITRVQYGAAAVQRFDHAFAGMFASVTRLPDWPPWRSARPAVEAVIEVEEGALEVSLGNDVPYGGGTADRVLAVYRACLYRPDGARVTCWEALSEAIHQRSPGDSVRKSVVRLADRAMTDAVAGLVARIDADPAVRAWAVAASAPSAIEPAEVAATVALVGWPLSPERRDEVERVSRHLRTAIEREAPGVRILADRELREALYPLLEPSTQPRTEEDFAALLARADVQARLRSLGVSQLVAFAGGEDAPEEYGAALCSYYGCYGYAWRSERSHLDAVLWDLAAVTRREALEVTATGTTAIPIFVLPLPLPARTLEHACDRLGQRVAASLKVRAEAPPQAPR